MFQGLDSLILIEYVIVTTEEEIKCWAQYGGKRSLPPGALLYEGSIRLMVNTCSEDSVGKWHSDQGTHRNQWFSKWGPGNQQHQHHVGNDETCTLSCLTPNLINQKPSCWAPQSKG